MSPEKHYLRDIELEREERALNALLSEGISPEPDLEDILWMVKYSSPEDRWRALLIKYLYLLVKRLEEIKEELDFLTDLLCR